MRVGCGACSRTPARLQMQCRVAVANVSVHRAVGWAAVGRWRHVQTVAGTHRVARACFAVLRVRGWVVRRLCAALSGGVCWNALRLLGSVWDAVVVVAFSPRSWRRRLG